jgi:hypothetical protein
VTGIGDTYASILAPLGVVSRRRRVRNVVHAVLAGAVTGLGAYLVVQIAARMGTVIDPTIPVVAVAGATIAGALLVTEILRPTPLAEAFRLDRAGGLEEGFGTAVELARASAPVDTPVVAKFIRSVEARLGGLPETRVVPVFTKGFWVGLVLLALLAVATIYVRQMPQPMTAETLAGEQDAAALETIESVTEMLATDAELRENPLLEAIAQTLADKVAEAAGAPLDERLAREVNDLLDQAAASYGEDAPSWLGSTEGSRLLELDEALAEMDPADAPGAQPPLELAVDPYYVPPEERFSSPPGEFSTAPEAGEGSDETGLTAVDPEASGNLEGLTLGQSPQAMTEEEIKAIGATPVGAALDSGRGVSHAAGLGEEDFRADDEFARLGFEPTEDMLISAEPQPDGARIRIEIVPDANVTNVAGQANSIGGQSGTGSTEPVDREFIPVSARSIAARYFERTAQ